MEGPMVLLGAVPSTAGLLACCQRRGIPEACTQKTVTPKFGGQLSIASLRASCLFVISERVRRSSATHSTHTPNNYFHAFCVVPLSDALRCSGASAREQRSRKRRYK